MNWGPLLGCGVLRQIVRSASGFLVDRHRPGVTGTRRYCPAHDPACPGAAVWRARAPRLRWRPFRPPGLYRRYHPSLGSPRPLPPKRPLARTDPAPVGRASVRDRPFRCPAPCPSATPSGSGEAGAAPSCAAAGAESSSESTFSDRGLTRTKCSEFFSPASCSRSSRTQARVGVVGPRQAITRALPRIVMSYSFAYWPSPGR